LEIRFIDQLQRVTSNCNNISNLHNLQVTTVGATSSVCCVFTSRSLVTASNSGDSSASAFTSLLSEEYLTTHCTELNSKVVPLITPRHGPTENAALLLLLQSLPWENVCLRRRYSVTAAYTCSLRICCPATDVSLFVSRSLSSNGTTRYNIKTDVSEIECKRVD
jgi:hypothetical protein